MDVNYSSVEFIIADERASSGLRLFLVLKMVPWEKNEVVLSSMYLHTFLL